VLLEKFNFIPNLAKRNVCIRNVYSQELLITIEKLHILLYFIVEIFTRRNLPTIYSLKAEVSLHIATTLLKTVTCIFQWRFNFSQVFFRPWRGTCIPGLSGSLHNGVPHPSRFIVSNSWPCHRKRSGM